MCSSDLTACIGCGRCVSACPENLMPTMMFKAALKKDTARFTALEGMECLECGACAYVCPAKRPLTQGFKEMKRRVGAERRAAAAKAKAEAEAKAAEKKAEEVQK